MSDQRPTDVLGSLPHTRPHRRSEKRAPRPATPTPATDGSPIGESTPTARPKPAAKPNDKAKPATKRRPLEQPPQPAGVPSARPRRPLAAGKAGNPSTATGHKPATGAQRKSATTAQRKPATAAQRKRATAAQRKSAAAQRSEVQPSSRTGGTDLLGTAVQAAAELAEIGLSVGARAVRRAVSRLPRP